MIYKPTRREFLKYAGVGALAFGVPMLLKVRPAYALATRGVGPTYISVAATQTNNNTLASTTIGRSLVAVIFWYDPTNAIIPVISVSGESNMTLIPGSLFANAVGNSVSGQIAYLANNTAGGTKTITVDLGVSGYAEFTVMEYAGLLTSGQPDNSAFNDLGAPGPNPSMSLTTINTSALIVAGYMDNTSISTAGSAYTAFGGGGFTNNLGNALAEDNLNAGSAGPKTVDVTGTGAVYALTGASFKIAGGAAVPVRHGVINQ